MERSAEATPVCHSEERSDEATPLVVLSEAKNPAITTSRSHDPDDLETLPFANAQGGALALRVTFPLSSLRQAQGKSERSEESRSEATPPSPLPASAHPEIATSRLRRSSQ